MNQPNASPGTGMKVSRNAYVSGLYPLTFTPPIVLDDGSVIAAAHILIHTWGSKEPLRTVVCAWSIPQASDLFDLLEHGQTAVEHAWSSHPWLPRVQPLDTAPERIQAAYRNAVPARTWDIVRNGGGPLVEDGKSVAA